MVTLRLSQSVDKKEYKWSVVKSHNPWRIEIITWKGTYELKNQALSTPIGYLIVQYHVENIKDCLLRYDYQCVGPASCYWHPIVLHWHGSWETVVSDILQWILAQPPQENQFQAAYLEDRASVEKTFEELAKR